MNENKVLQELGIKYVKEFNNEHKEILVYQFAEKIFSLLYENEEQNINEIIQKMNSCKMLIAEFEEFELTANYYLKNQTIYFNKKKLYTNLDEFIIHEFIHYYQDIRQNGILMKFGLCECLDSKLLGVGLNEASVHYIANKILKNPLENYMLRYISLKTRNKNYYPILSNLMEQITYLIGDKELIDSTLNCNEKFKNKFIDLCGEKAYKELINILDKILETENLYSQAIDIKCFEKLENLYVKAQNTILLSYFENYFPLIETSKELEDYQEKLFGIRELISDIDNYNFYEELKKQQIKLIKKRIIKMNRKFAEKSLIKKEKNIFHKLLFKIRNLVKSEIN